MVTRKEVEDAAIRDNIAGTKARLDEIGPHMTIFTRAHVPLDLAQAWLQHLRDFDKAHPDCHFEVAVDARPGESIGEMVDKLRVNPELTFTQIFKRG